MHSLELMAIITGRVWPKPDYPEIQMSYDNTGSLVLCLHCLQYFVLDVDEWFSCMVDDTFALFYFRC